MYLHKNNQYIFRTHTNGVPTEQTSIMKLSSSLIYTQDSMSGVMFHAFIRSDFIFTKICNELGRMIRLSLYFIYSINYYLYNPT